MRILIHINSLGYGGAEKVVSILSGHLAKKGYQVILATEWEEEREYPLPEGVKRVHVGLAGESRAAGADDVVSGSDASDGKITSGLGNVSRNGAAEAGLGRLGRARLRLKRLREAIRAEQPDLVLSFVKKANYRAAFALMGSRVPLVISVRNDPAVDYAGLKNSLSNMIMLHKAAGCVFQTSRAQRFFGDALAGRSKVILNPVEERFLHSDWEGPGSKEAPVIVNVGRITSQKNQLMLVKAFEEMLRSRCGSAAGSAAADSIEAPARELQLYGSENSEDQSDGVLSQGSAAADSIEAPAPQLHIYGAADPEGETCRELTKYIEANGLTDAVKIHPPTAHVEEVLKKAAMFVLSSDYEGLPNALLEAMVMGVPCISTDCPCGGPAEVIRDGENGLLTPVGDAGALAKAMERLLSAPDYAAKLGEEAKQLRARVTPDKVCGEWEEYLLQAR